MDESNSIFTSEYLWTNMIVGEVFPTVTTPSTWSVWQDYFQLLSMGSVPTIERIAGQPYLNFSLTYSFLQLIMRTDERAMAMIKDSIGVPPAGVEIPQFPVSWKTFLFQVLPKEARSQLKKNKLRKDAHGFLILVRERCQGLKVQIEGASPEGLIDLWTEEIRPLWMEIHPLQDKMNEELNQRTQKLRTDLSTRLGDVQANALLTTISSAGELASLGPLLGLSKVMKGELSREEYSQLYGHRGPHENELAELRPHEDPTWLDRQLAEFARSPIDVASLSQKRKAEFNAILEEICRQLPPKKAQGVARKAAALLETNNLREETRAELTRIVDLIRTFFLRAGELSRLNDGVFFLSVDELIAVLSGDPSPAEHIPPRRQAYEKFRALPPLPAWIRGPFDPFQWAADPNRREDVFDIHAPGQPPASEADRVIIGKPGSAGRVEGIIHRIDSPEEGDELQPGEILLARTTNVGWTPLFPRAAAVITDIGGSLSHAAILGIPAVVGCGDATHRLKNGDRVRVDGELGEIDILEIA
jgi:phosphohistidine swiveling domain-containing protein